MFYILEEHLETMELIPVSQREDVQTKRGAKRCITKPGPHLIHLDIPHRIPLYRLNELRKAGTVEVKKS